MPGTVNLMSEFLFVNFRQIKDEFHVNKSWIKTTFDQPHHLSQYQTQHEVDQLGEVVLRK